ncbi:hypothetical protein H7W66_001268 [Campylobacter coli]|uniref:Protein-export protein SecB n=1 Tax=Helicobacter pullorum MIT 98-5489 TaxID=537972 RepID=C5F1W2_9HELI|nr:protein-export chaperone SecB [Helicobacter pullorum]EFB7094533.1 hypothetical protein [Campylobacter coli]EEQ64256.1 putative protein-export chaperone SecB [Helicobacter pullorum MIT 98-5489]EFS2167940.1 hypothetical protein [Campylobacter coli]EGD3384454.1 hypothetical protein [Campylobacter coli]KPH51699.1 hypothetical protein HPU229254_05990 [Helicobacter pullorum]
MSIKSHNTFKIKTIQLKKFDFEQTGKLVVDKKKEINLTQKIGAIAKQENTNSYILQLNVDMAFKQDEQDLFFIDSVIVGAIEVGKNFDEKLLNNMVAIMFSYLRPIVAQMTVMAKLPPLDLQPANFEEFEVKVERREPKTKSANKK